MIIYIYIYMIGKGKAFKWLYLDRVVSKPTDNLCVIILQAIDTFTSFTATMDAL